MTTVTSNVFEAATLALGEPRYVATNGANTNPGTELLPWATIQYAVDTVSPGQTIYVRGGVYSESEIAIPKEKGGTPGNYVTLRNYPGETPIIDGSAFGPNNHAVFRATYGISYYIIQGFEMRNFYGGGFLINGPGSHIEIRDNYLHDNVYNSDGTKENTTYGGGTAHGIAIQAYNALETGTARYRTGVITDVVVDNNTLKRLQTGASIAYNEGITLAWSLKRFEMTNNHLEDLYFIGLDTIGAPEIAGEPYYWGFPQYGRIAGNTVINAGSDPTPVYVTSSGYHGDGMVDIVIEDNVFRDMPFNGMDTTFEPGKKQAERIIIRNNKFLRCKVGLVAGGFGPLYEPPDATNMPASVAFDIRIAHNSVYAVDPGVGTVATVAFKPELSDNILWRNNIAETNPWDIDNDPTGTPLSYWNFNANTYGSYPGSGPDLDWNCYYASDPRTLWWWEGSYSGDSLTAFKATTGQETNSVWGNPLYSDPATNDLTLQVGSAAIDAGTPLTTAVGTGNNETTLVVADSLWFHDGMGIEGLAGDTIQVGSNTAVITDINHTTNTITLGTPLTWSNGDSVSYPWNGAAPDMGAHEHTIAAFPNAQGFGAETTHGRGGQVEIVSNTNDSGAGSLREAMLKTYPRIIVFTTSGTIYLNTSIWLGEAHSNVAVFGQTAPGDGICIAGADGIGDSLINLSHFSQSNDSADGVFHDGLFQHLRFRHTSRPGSEWQNADNIDFFAGTHHVVFDHCSFTLSGDESYTFWLSSPWTSGLDIHDVTFSHCIHGATAWPDNPNHGFYNKGPLISGGGLDQDVYNCSFHHNFGCHVHYRDWSVSKGSGNPIGGPYTQGIEFINNVHYASQAQHYNFNQNQYNSGTELAHDVIGDYFMAGPSPLVARSPVLIANEGVLGSSPPNPAPLNAFLDYPLHLEDLTWRNSDGSKVLQAWDNNHTVVDQYSNAVYAPRTSRLTNQPTNPVTITTPSQAYTDVVVNKDCGATKPKLDSMDTYLIEGPVNLTLWTIANVPFRGGGTMPTLSTYDVPVDTSGNGLPDSYQVSVLGKLAGDAYNPAATFTVGNGYSDIENAIHGGYFSATWYVDQSVASSGEGRTEATAFKTIAEGIAAMSGGETLQVNAGTYTESAITSIPSGTSWSDATTLRANGSVKILHSDPGGTSARFFTIDYKQYIDIDGFELDGENLITYAVNLYKSKYIRIQNMHIHHTDPDSSQGIFSTDGADSQYIGLEILNNTIEYICINNDFGHATYIDNDFTKMWGNVVSNIGGWGCHLYTGANDCDVQYNTAHDCGYGATQARGSGVMVAGDRNLVANNISYDNSSAGVEVFSGSDNKVYNNTTHNNGAVGIRVATFGGNNNLVTNNLVDEPTADFADAGTATVFTTNWTGAPGFVNEPNSDFRITSGSAAKDAGTTVAEVTDDFARDPRTAPYSIGAYEQDS